MISIFGRATIELGDANTAMLTLEAFSGADTFNIDGANSLSQVNVNAGLLPAERDNGIRYLNVPLNLFSPADELGEPK